MTSAGIEAVITAAAPAPVGPYNQAVKAGGMLYCSGQIQARSGGAHHRVPG